MFKDIVSIYNDNWHGVGLADKVFLSIVAIGMIACFAVSCFAFVTLITKVFA